MSLFVNGQTIEDALIREEANQIKAGSPADLDHEDSLTRDLRIREWARENVIARVLLEQAALSDPTPLPAGLLEEAVKGACSSLAISPEIGDDGRKQMEIRLRTERLVNQIQASVARPTSSEVASYYRKNQDRFYRPELVHAAHIVKNVDEQTNEEVAAGEIAKACEALRNGQPFHEVADLYSDCPGRGGDLGYFPRGELVEKFEAVVFALKPGQISDIFRSPFGFHIATVYDRKPAGIRSLPEVKSEIQNLIHNGRKQEALHQYVAKLRASAEIRNIRPSNQSLRAR